MTLMPTQEAPITRPVLIFPSSSRFLNATASMAVRILNTPGRSRPGMGGMTAEAPVLIRILSYWAVFPFARCIVLISGSNFVTGVSR